MPSGNVSSTVERGGTTAGTSDTQSARLWRAVEPYIYLCFLGFLAFEPALSPNGRWLPTLLLVAVFVPIYVAAVRWQGVAERGKHYVACGAMAALAIIGVAFQLNVNATIFLVYAAASATRDTTAPRAVVVVGLALAILAGLFFTTDYPLALRWAPFLPVLLLVPVIAVTQLLDAERERHNLRLKLSEDEIKRLARIAERERISRDLHDLLGHTLSTITLKSALATRLAPSEPDRAGKEMREVESISREALDQVREAVRGYRAGGLAEELSGIRKTLETAGIGFDMEVEPVDLAPEQESALALALRESATNVLRHSGATEVRAALRAEGTDVVLTIADNGQGGGSEGNGLSGIRLRMQALGGTFSRVTEEGTRLTVRLPKRIRHSTAESTQQKSSGSSSPKISKWCLAHSPPCSNSKVSTWSDKRWMATRHCGSSRTRRRTFCSRTSRCPVSLDSSQPYRGCAAGAVARLALTGTSKRSHHSQPLVAGDSVP